MALKTYKFRDLFEFEHHLNGGVIAGDIRNGVAGLEGKTLEFAKPDHRTCTFGAPSDGVKHSLADIKAQLEAAVGGLLVFQKDGKLCMREDRPTPGIGGVDILGGTACQPLGLGGATTGFVYYPEGPTAPFFVSFSLDNHGILLVVME